MQLDIFEHSHDVALRNAVIDALADRDATTATRAIGELSTEYPDDTLLPLFNLLAERLALRVAGPLNKPSTAMIVRATDDVIPAAQSLFGKDSETWLSPFWSELAIAAKGLQFDARDEILHSAPFFLRAGKWHDALQSLESIPSWRRQPAPLAWMIEATAAISGADAIWAYFAELSWMAPRRAQTLVGQLNMAELTKLVRIFHVEFEGDGREQDFAWFIAWGLITCPQLMDRLQGVEAGADTPANHSGSCIKRDRRSAHDHPP